MASRIFIFVGHPRASSLSHGMADAYQAAAEAGGAEVRRINLSDMDFDPDLTEGYHSRKTLEPCLENWRDDLTWCDHTCWAYPYWWGGMPAKMKGVIDRSFLPGFAMQYHDDDPWWDKLLEGRTADVMITSDSPAWFDSLKYGRPGKNQVKRLILEFSGIKVNSVLQVGTVKDAPPKKIERWIRKAGALGKKAARI